MAGDEVVAAADANVVGESEVAMGVSSSPPSLPARADPTAETGLLEGAGPVAASKDRASAFAKASSSSMAGGGKGRSVWVTWSATTTDTHPNAQNAAVVFAKALTVKLIRRAGR